MFSGCLSVSACVCGHPGVCPVSLMSYKPVDGISVIVAGGDIHIDAWAWKCLVAIIERV